MLLWFRYGCSGHRMQPNMHEPYYGLGMDALVTGCSRTGTLLWFGHGCSGHRTQSKMDVIIVWAWMLWSSDAVEHERHCGLGMDASVIAHSQQRTLLWFGYGCSGQSSDAVEH